LKYSSNRAVDKKSGRWNVLENFNYVQHMAITDTYEHLHSVT